MKTFILTLLFISAELFGQVTIDNGIYRGRKFPFLECYLIVNDSIATIEEFGYKAGQYFDYEPTRILYRPLENNVKNIALIYKNDSIQVFKVKSIIKVELKGIGILDMMLTNLTDSAITEKKNNHLNFRTYHSMLNELKTNHNFNDSAFNKIFQSYNFKDHYSLNTIAFRSKCEDFKVEVRKKFHD